MTTYTAPSDYPSKVPLLTGVLAELIAEADATEGRRPQAFDTATRYSDAGRCGRAIGYGYIERTTGQVLSSDPREDPAGHFRMWVGRSLHEHVMDAIVKRYGGQVEVPSRLGDTTSGHCDWVGVIDGTDLGRTVYELKTEGSYGFDRAIGLRRKNWKQDHPEGPRSSAKMQGALNAVAHDCDTLIIGVVAMEAVSVALADKLGMSVLDRIVAEWTYQRSEFSQWAAMELARMEAIADALDQGSLPEREAVGQEMERVALDPLAASPKWFCMYCPYLDTCRRDATAGQ